MDSAMKIWPELCDFGFNKCRFGIRKCRFASGMASIAHICNKELASANQTLPQQSISGLSNANLATAMQI